MSLEHPAHSGGEVSVKDHIELLLKQTCFDPWKYFLADASLFNEKGSQAYIAFFLLNHEIILD